MAGNGKEVVGCASQWRQALLLCLEACCHSLCPARACALWGSGAAQGRVRSDFEEWRGGREEGGEGDRGQEGCEGGGGVVDQDRTGRILQDSR